MATDINTLHDELVAAKQAEHLAMERVRTLRQQDTTDPDLQEAEEDAEAKVRAYNNCRHAYDDLLHSLEDERIKSKDRAMERVGTLKRDIEHNKDFPSNMSNTERLRKHNELSLKLEQAVEDAKAKVRALKVFRNENVDRMEGLDKAGGLDTHPPTQSTHCSRCNVRL